MRTDNGRSGHSTRAVLREVRRIFALDLDGIHGAPHWARVRLTGLRLAESTGARTDVVELFALIHDSRRIHDGRDENHGDRAAMLALELNASVLKLDACGLELLRHACRYHSDGLTEADVTIQTCWDADRLDLGRVGIRPIPERLCTNAAREVGFLEAAYQRSVGVPVWARAER